MRRAAAARPTGAAQAVAIIVAAVQNGVPVTERESRRWPFHKTAQGVRCRWSAHSYVGPECPCPDGCEAS